MAVTNAGALQSQIPAATFFIELQQSLSSDVTVISPFLDQLMQFITKFRPLDGNEMDIEIAVREAIANAVIHGNHENRSTPVYVTCRCTANGEISIIVRDQGQGFDVRGVPDPTLEQNRLSTHGRGIHIMQALMDAVRFEEGGRVVRMRKNPSGSSLGQKTSE
jgi:serine/threonine-protein kinase RsbW